MLCTQADEGTPFNPQTYAHTHAHTHTHTNTWTDGGYNCYVQKQTPKKTLLVTLSDGHNPRGKEADDKFWQTHTNTHTCARVHTHCMLAHTHCMHTQNTDYTMKAHTHTRSGKLTCGHSSTRRRRRSVSERSRTSQIVTRRNYPVATIAQMRPLTPYNLHLVTGNDVTGRHQGSHVSLRAHLHVMGMLRFIILS